MTSLFGALDAAVSGARLADTWMTTIADNVANANTVRPAGVDPYRSKFVVPQADAGGGVKVAAVVEQAGTPDVEYDPSNPLADRDGYVTRPMVDMTEELTNSMVASRLYQASLSVHATAKEAYKSALTIGSR